MPKSLLQLRTPVRLASTLIAFAVAGSGCVTTADGEVVGGLTSAAATFSYSGVYDSPNIPVHLEVLDQPDGVAAWVTVPNTTVNTSPTGNAYPANTTPLYYTWSLSGIPVPANKTERWPQGGLVRVRVVANDPKGHGSSYVLAISDEYGQQCFDSHPGQLWTQTYLACGRDPVHGLSITSNNPTPADTFANHTTPSYLTFSPVPQVDTAAYYQATGAPQTLTAFKNNNNFNNVNAIVSSARYFNSGDLGIGRDMHCASLGGNVACYVSNYAPPNPNNPNNGNPNLPPVVFGDQVNSMKFVTDATQKPFATVAMTFSGSITAPNAVKFMVFDKDENLTTGKAFLDSKGANTNIPSNCVACHGGKAVWDGNNKTITGAHFLPFDTFNSLKFDANAGYPNDSESLRKLNAMVRNAGATPAIADYLDHSYSGPIGTVGSTPVNTYVPSSWTTAGDDQAGLYKTMVAPFCRTCHMSHADPTTNLTTGTDFTSYTAMHGNGAVGSFVCGLHSMPHAEQTLKNFWNSPARAHLTRLFDIYGSCNPN